MSKYNPNIHDRRSIRVKGYDYSQAGLYFITICTQHMQHFFGKIVGTSLVDAQFNKCKARMVLNDPGQMVESEWLKLPVRFPNIELNEFVVMPNHFHAILQIVGATVGTTTVGTTLVVARNNDVGDLITNVDCQDAIVLQNDIMLNKIK